MGGLNPRISLNESDHQIADGAGNATVTMRPDGALTRWYPESAHVVSTSDTDEAKCTIYIGPKPGDQYFVDATGSGSFGDSTSRVYGRTIGRHQDPAIIAVWSGATPGSQCTLTVIGTKTVG